MVAENSIVCRARDTSETILSTSGIKPMSSIRSASSITRMRTSFSSRRPRSNTSSSLPGVAISTSAPRSSTLIWSPIELAADDQRLRELVIFAVGVEILGDLRRQLARRLEDQRPRHSRPGATGGKDVDHRQSEGRGLTGAGLSAAQYVPTRQDNGYGLFLYRRGVFVASIGNGAQHRVAELQVGKVHKDQIQAPPNRGAN